MPDYCAAAETREEAVCAWAVKYVQNARIALEGAENRGLAEAKAELETALKLLEHGLSEEGGRDVTRKLLFCRR